MLMSNGILFLLALSTFRSHCLRLEISPVRNEFSDLDTRWAKGILQTDQSFVFEQRYGHLMNMSELVSILRENRVSFSKIAAWKTTSSAECRSSQKAIYFATNPRSGNTFSRLMLEEATGVATLAIFENERCTLKQGCPCGITDDCSRVRFPSDKDSYLMKVHHPFVAGLADNLNPPIERAVLTVRNPIDNYIAWRKYKNNKKIETFPEYLKMWTHHFMFWFKKARDACMQVTLVRFEDIVNTPEHVLPIFSSTMGYGSPDIERALRLYPPSPSLKAKHVYFNLTCASEVPPDPKHQAIQDWAHLLLSESEDLLKELGYHTFITKLTELK